MSPTCVKECAYTSPVPVSRPPPYTERGLRCARDCTGSPGECVLHEFEGPVKIILVDRPKTNYYGRVYGAATLAFALVCMGATVMAIILFTLTLRLPIINNLHVLFCTIGLFVPIGIMHITALFGPATLMKISDRKFYHSLCQVIGMMFCLSSILLMYISCGLELTSHCISGIVATMLAFVALICGPFAYWPIDDERRVWIAKVMKLGHAVIGGVAFAFSSWCTYTGINKKSFIQYAYVQELPTFLDTFILIYTVIVLVAPLYRALVFKYTT